MLSKETKRIVESNISLAIDFPFDGDWSNSPYEGPEQQFWVYRENLEDTMTEYKFIDEWLEAQAEYDRLWLEQTQMEINGIH